MYNVANRHYLLLMWPPCPKGCRRPVCIFVITHKRGWAIGSNVLRDVEWEVHSYWMNWKYSEGSVRDNQGGDPEFAWRNCRKPRNIPVTVVADPVAI